MKRFGGELGHVDGLDFWSPAAMLWVYVLANCARVPWWIPVWFVVISLVFFKLLLKRNCWKQMRFGSRCNCQVVKLVWLAC